MWWPVGSGDPPLDFYLQMAPMPFLSGDPKGLTPGFQGKRGRRVASTKEPIPMHPAFDLHKVTRLDTVGARRAYQHRKCPLVSFRAPGGGAFLLWSHRGVPVVAWAYVPPTYPAWAGADTTHPGLDRASRIHR